MNRKNRRNPTTNSQPPATNNTTRLTNMEAVRVTSKTNLRYRYPEANHKRTARIALPWQIE
jgi:hypothetical protein